MSLPKFMRAVPTPEAAGSSSLVICEEALPIPGDYELLIKVTAAGINRPDILQRDGFYPAPKGHSHILGLEVAGEVVAVGAKVSAHKIGDMVAALVNGGGYAEYCTAHEGAALRVPEGLSMIEAAGLPETVFTVWHNVFQRGGLKAGEWFMVHGGTSGIGTTAIQMGKALGARVITTAGSAAKCEACKALGADVVINYKEENFVEVSKAATDGRGVDVILDMVGGAYIEKNFSAAAVEGRIVQIAFLGGAKYEVNFMRLMMKRLIFTGSTLRAQDDQAKAAIGAEVYREIWPLIEADKIKPQIDKIFAFNEVSKAHDYMESGQNIGKIILDLTA